MTATPEQDSSSPWRSVLGDPEPVMTSGRGSFLGTDTPRRARKWHLQLECGHQAIRPVRYGPHPDFPARSRGGTQFRSATDALPAPRRVRCDLCASGGAS